MEDDETPRGYRKDGKPHKTGNTREDGGYAIGRARPPQHSRFAVNDGRQRGRRTKGTKNLATEWAEELAERITVTEGGKSKRISKQRGVIKTTTASAMKGNIRAAEVVFRNADIARPASPALALSDSEIIESWFAQRVGQVTGDPLPEITDDAQLSAGDDQ